MPVITPLEGVDNSSRLLRTSIYLRTSLNSGEGTVQDLLDCVVPIVSDSIERLPAGQIVIKDLQQAVMNRFSFKMPTFTIEHVLGRLAQKEKVTYDKDQRHTSTKEGRQCWILRKLLTQKKKFHHWRQNSLNLRCNLTKWSPRHSFRIGLMY